MKKCLILSLVVLLSAGFRLLAGTVSIPDAQNVALNFFKTNAPAGTQLTATLKYTKTDAGQTDFYVFDINPVTGFVIVAADDNVIPILAYSTTGNFRTDFNHAGVNHWVNKTSANIRIALQSNVIADAGIQGQWAAYRQGSNPVSERSGSVSPLCATAWDQENDVSSPPPFLYNLFCPYNAADAQRTLTGCEATAMAQIMKFWNYPAQGMGSYSYIDDTIHGYSYNYGPLSSNFAAHTYRWQAMPNVLTGAESLSQDSAVDGLMYDCAVSVGMDFGDDNQDGSGSEALITTELQTIGDSICVQYALVKYFGYDADTIRGVYEANYTASSWTAVIEHELNMGRPVLYEGNDATQGGHAWVCDGYDATDKLHMNWGWGGMDNGYFAINNLTTSGNFNPVQDEDALIGIMPKHHAAGVSELNENLAFDMFPNPAAGTVMLLTKTAGSGARWTIRNIVGQALISRDAEAVQTPVDIAGFSPGIYCVELQAGERSAVKKLVISK